MAGPGGGGRSGGGGRGGFSGGGSRGGFSGGGRSGGGFHGGGFHGGPHHRPPHRPHYRPFMGGWGYGPHYHGGCLGGIISMALAPVILIMVAVTLVIALVFSSVSEISQGGSIRYNEKSFQSYAAEKYEEIFGDSAYEDNILLVVLTEENAYDYYYIAWVGDHVAYEVSDLFGDNQTALGRAMESYISDTDYTHSLDTDLGRVLKTMAQRVQALKLESNLICQESNDGAPSQLYNYSALPITDSTVNYALTQFTTLTGIHCSIVVADMEDVFERGISGGTIVMLVLLAIVVILLVTTILKKRRSNQAPEGAQSSSERHKDPF